MLVEPYGVVAVPLVGAISVALLTDTGGQAHLMIPGPLNIPAGVRLYAQSLVVDPSSRNALFAFSNAALTIAK